MAGRVDLVVRVARGPGAWARRALLAAVLVGAAVIPGRASSQEAQHCAGTKCQTPGSILWMAALPGAWLAEQGESGTVSSEGDAYAAIGGGLAVVAGGTTVAAFGLRTGRQAWQVNLSDVPFGSVVAGVRAFGDVVAVGVQLPGAQAGRDEVILSSATGLQLRVYAAAPYGGAVAADEASTVIVGTASVRAYDNATGRTLWSRAISAASQAWRVSGSYLYVTDPGSGRAATRTLRRIDLRTGAERVIRAVGPAFPGDLSAVVGGVALFSDAAGVFAYSLATGLSLWSVRGAALELADAGQGVVYLAKGATLAAVSAATGVVVGHGALSVAASLYSVAGGVALGLDQNALGDAWGYDLATRRVVWTTAALPWPHFFVDLSGLGGSASPRSDVVLLATCGQAGAKAPGASAPACRQPQLAAVLVGQ